MTGDSAETGGRALRGAGAGAAGRIGDEPLAGGLFEEPLYVQVYRPTEFDTAMDVPRLALDASRDCVHGWDITNPSLLVRNHSVLALFRASCIELRSRRKHRWYSKLILGTAPAASLRAGNASWEWSKFHEVSDPRFNAQDPLVQECLLAGKDFSAGPEDPKLVLLGGKTYVVVTALDTLRTESVSLTEDDRPGCEESGLHGFLPHLFEVTSLEPFTYGRGVKLVFDGMGDVEKNWNFFSYRPPCHDHDAEHKLMAVYKVHPHTIVQVDVQTGEVRTAHVDESPLVAQLAQSVALDAGSFHGGSGTARITEKAVAGRIVWELHPGHCMAADANASGSAVRMVPCRPNDATALWMAARRFSRGLLRLEANPSLCLDSVNRSLLVSKCMPSRPEQIFEVAPSGDFGMLTDGSSGCVRGSAEATDAGGLSMSWCGGGEVVTESSRMARSFQFTGRQKRDYHLGVFHARPLGKHHLPYRNWPYRFSTEPPFEILEIGSEITPYLLTTPNPSYGVPVQFVTSIVYDRVVSQDLGNIIVGYGSGDTSARTFRMSLGEFESTFFGKNNASSAPDVFNGAAADIQLERRRALQTRSESSRLRTGPLVLPDSDAVNDLSRMNAIALGDDESLSSYLAGLGAETDAVTGAESEAPVWPAPLVSNRWRSKLGDADDADDVADPLAG